MIKRILVCAAVAVMALCMLAQAGPQVSMRHTEYEYSDEDFPNPERGVFKHLGLTASSGNTLSLSALQSYRNQGFSLVYIGVILDSYINGGDISDSFISRLRTSMGYLRQAGLKAIVRFYYSDDSSKKPYDAPLQSALRHIEQLKLVLEENKDVIALVEAGFVGVWGEWYLTENYFFNPKTYNDYSKRRTLIEALADAVPQDRLIALRTPMYKMGILGIGSGNTLLETTAHDGSLAARLGFHNDCFLANADDAGTYQGLQANRQFTAADSRYTVMGGETCSDANTYTEMANARAAFADYHWTYLNADFHPGTLGAWKQNGFMNEVCRKLGYRLSLLESDMPVAIKAGDNARISITLQNLGWAAPINPRDVELVLEPAGGGLKTKYKVEVDPRTWQPGYQHKIDAEFALPSDMEPGNYNIYLNLPDPCASLASRVEYSIRLANLECWDSARGMNLLGTMQVTEGAGVGDIVADSPALDSNLPVYDTMGRRVGNVQSRSTLSPGIYIISGKKYRF